MFLHKKLANMSKFSLIIIMEKSECGEALSLSNLSMSFYMSWMLNPEKWNVSFSQMLCIASMLGWSLYLKITLRVGSAMFSKTKSNSLYLEIINFFTIFERELFGVSATSDSVFKFSPFLLILVLSLMRGLSESQSLSLNFPKEIHSNSFTCYKKIYFLPFYFSENYCKVLISSFFLQKVVLS